LNYDNPAEKQEKISIKGSPCQQFSVTPVDKITLLHFLDNPALPKQVLLLRVP
jgi:hypothetical protein